MDVNEAFKMDSEQEFRFAVVQMCFVANRPA